MVATNTKTQETQDEIPTLEQDVILDVRGLKTSFYTYEGVVKALDGVTVHLKKGDTLAFVGETGCGKSVTAKSIMRLVESPGRIEEGEVIFRNRASDGSEEVIDLLKLSTDEMRQIRGNRIGIVFQDPATYPNPVFRIGQQIAEVISLHQNLALDVLEMKIELLETTLAENPNAPNAAEIQDQIANYKSQLDDPPSPSDSDKKKVAEKRAVKMLKMVRMPTPEEVANQYPHELSGGMRQRALIAMALSCDPQILICDEATTALDVTVQAQVLKLLNELKSEFDSSIIIITHDLGVVAETCTNVAVMYAGVVVEYAATEDLFSDPIHPYTLGLLRAIPKLTEKTDRLLQIRGSVPNLISPPSGCRFHPRCDFATDICKEKRPPREEIKPGHWVECHNPQGSMQGKR